MSARIESTRVANGIIGKYDHEWIVVKLYDTVNSSAIYNLYINKEYIGYYPSVVEALAELVNQFEA